MKKILIIDNDMGVLGSLQKKLESAVNKRNQQLDIFITVMKKVDPTIEDFIHRKIRCP